MNYDQKDLMEQRNADEDELYAIFYGHRDIQPVVEKICTHLQTLDLGDRYTKIIQDVQHKHDRIPKLAIIIFGIWLCPTLKLGENAQPRRFEPFQKNIQTICMDILEGRALSVQEFVNNALTDYLVTPKEY